MARFLPFRPDAAASISPGQAQPAREKYSEPKKTDKNPSRRFPLQKHMRRMIPNGSSHKTVTLPYAFSCCFRLISGVDSNITEAQFFQ
jgi:hypothetical protein